MQLGSSSSLPISVVCIETARHRGFVPGRSTAVAWPCSACVDLPKQPSTHAEILPHSAAAPAYTHNQHLKLSQISSVGYAVTRKCKVIRGNRPVESHGFSSDNQTVLWIQTANANIRKDRSGRQQLNIETWSASSVAVHSIARLPCSTQCKLARPQRFATLTFIPRSSLSEQVEAEK